MPDIALTDVLLGETKPEDWAARVTTATPAVPGADTVPVRPDGSVAKVFTDIPDQATLGTTLRAPAGHP
jgi:hypothetical protein